MQKGSLLVRTYIADMLIPVRDVRVTVTENNGNGEEILAFRLTDENGKTDIIEIDTPDMELSLDQNNTLKPFTSVNIKVEKEGFIIFIIQNVQIFANRLSEQNIEMIQLPEK
ncbi:MAG: hypothetical protein IJ332_04925 [Clostridia bacterium]|nr:hypothetical protein [Clostridia bacterium]